MVRIDPGNVHLWLVFFDEIRGEILSREYRALLSEAERSQELRFLFDRDRRRYLVTRALLRLVLSKYARVAPRDWRFALNPYGRPEVANDDIEAQRITFSISHANSLIVLGVTCGGDLGVDTESVSAGEIPIDIADRFFAPDEVAALNALPREQHQQRFFEYWTLKESYIKARSMGLSIPLDQFSFHFPQEGRVRMMMDMRLGDSPSRWQFWQLQPAPEYLVAVCAGRVQAERPRLKMKRIVPLIGEEMLECLPSRVSE